MYYVSNYETAELEPRMAIHHSSICVTITFSERMYGSIGLEMMPFSQQRLKARAQLK